MTPTMMRQLWSLIEKTQAAFILKLDDPSLVQWLLHQLKKDQTLDHEQTDVLSDYLHNRLSLIRDLAQQR